MELSKHAEIRSQQRLVPKDCIDMIMKYGTPTRKAGKALEFKLHGKSRDRVISHLKHLITIVDRCTNKAVLVYADNVCGVLFII
jgi:hypothetical protein